MARSSTTYPRKWSTGKTKVIRVPENLAEPLLKVAERMDGAEGFVVRETAGTLLLEPQTTPRKVKYSSSKPVNVASVPQRSPFRYPGGKTWFVPYVRDWLGSKSPPPGHLIEPFAGGGIISLTAGFEQLVGHVVMSEIDPYVSSVWKAIFNGKAEWLAKRILEFDLDTESAKLELQKEPGKNHQLAFQTILRNRVQRGGIMAPGGGLMKAGENGKGIRSRWYPETLARRIREINAMKARFTFLEEDAFRLIEKWRDDPDAAFYIDPPYTKAGRRLYRAWEVDHHKLFAEMAKCAGDFLMSYDNTEEIQTYAKIHGFETREIAMKSTHHAKKNELVIGRDLSWLGI